MQEMKIIIAKDGKVTIDVDGVKGPSCKDLTRKLEEALGSTVDSTVKTEYYEQEQGLDNTQTAGY